ncbi:MAG: Regulatory protein RecX [Candidatus Roizmanbacteria bacterium GW2011_GWA2_37_7]|uniref:Regulatory protein RecX n=1 Tax=Candidatus Roizmanbacteria bacterium GW2011_GWA2_37_7 TaxID=1618481 RepID=A0A0G0H9V2_9BACT|nr:MAG: Regulatory protein RecX [Candidatus Roizmanbacteria bacterium GW2011_GWA2_37_7]
MNQRQKQVQILIEKALFYLRFRARSEQEMRQYLQKKSQTYRFDEENIKDTIDHLIKHKYIDDNKFAQAYVRSRTYINPKGNYAIIQELLQKGIKKKIIDLALQTSEIDEYSRALSVLKKKNNSLAPLPAHQKKARALAHLQRRGFSYDTAIQAYKQYFNTTF